MAGKSNIEWCTDTWNPTVGCSIVSPGCTNCYAMKQAARIEAMQPGSHYAGTTKIVNGNAVWTGKLKQSPEHILTAPLKWKKPRRIFVNSMSDLFHESVPDAWIDKVFAVIALCPQHTFQVLTKRSKRMREYVSRAKRSYIIGRTIIDLLNKDGIPKKTITDANFPWPEGQEVGEYQLKTWPLPNVWLGVSAEDQTRADERIPDLLATPAAVRFVSYEPALGPINFRSIDIKDPKQLPKEMQVNDVDRHIVNSLEGITTVPGCHYQCPTIVPRTHFVAGEGGYADVATTQGESRKIDWIIAGGESGRHGIFLQTGLGPTQRHERPSKRFAVGLQGVSQMIDDVLDGIIKNACDYSFDPKMADLLSGVVMSPCATRIELLEKIQSKIGAAAFAELFANFIGLANSTLKNSDEMIDIILIVQGVRHPDKNEDRANLPTIFGALRGVIMADWIDASKVCEGCAFRLGTPANQSPITTTEAHDCVGDDGGTHFLCHEELDRRGQPFKACAGYAQSIKKNMTLPPKVASHE